MNKRESTYDSFLYGYGLTLGLFSVLEKIEVEKSTPLKYYFNFSNFLKAFLHAKGHQRILRDFNKYFEINNKTQITHLEVREILIANEDEIYLLGFERWFSQHIFAKDNPQLGNAKVYIYILYNYWYHLLYTQVLQDVPSIEFIRKVSQYIQGRIRLNGKIYTTNFDTILDRFLLPNHIHGTFALPLREIQDIFLDRVKDEFEYVYLFGTNGFEKINRLNVIKDLSQDSYDLDFFFKEDLELGHLLIYGVSFGCNQILPEDYLKEHPEHKDFYLLRSVDGHILSRIDSLFAVGKVSKVTISYHSKEDLDNIKNIIDSTKFKPIVEFKQSAEILDFKNLSH